MIAQLIMKTTRLYLRSQDSFNFNWYKESMRKLLAILVFVFGCGKSDRDLYLECTAPPTPSWAYGINIPSEKIGIVVDCWGNLLDCEAACYLEYSTCPALYSKAMASCDNYRSLLLSIIKAR